MNKVSDMEDWHKEMERKIKATFSGKYKVKISSEEKIQLPFLEVEPARRKVWYNPDVVFQNREDKSISYIVEVVDESPSRPVEFIGIIAMADICIGKMIEAGAQNKQTKPQLIFLLKKDLPKGRIEKFYDLNNKFRGCLENIKDPIMCREEEKIENVIK